MGLSPIFLFFFFQSGCGISDNLVEATAGCLCGVMHVKLVLGGRSFSCSLQLLQAVGEGGG